MDAGVDKIEAFVPAPSQQQLLEAGRAAVQYLHSLGITAWLDAMAEPPILATYRSLAQNGELTAHVAALPVVNPRNDLAKELEIVQKQRQEFAGTPNLTIPGIKVFADGVLEFPSQTASLTKPYRNTGKSGDLLFDPARFAELATAADKQGLIVHVHALGDRAVKESLNGIEAARKANGDSHLPHTLTHIQLADPEDFPRFRQLGVIAPFSCSGRTPDKKRSNWSSLILIPSCTDGNICSPLIRWTRVRRSQAPATGLSPPPMCSLRSTRQRHARGRKASLTLLRMPREAMLFAYTRNSARAMNQQDSIGSLAPGMQADLVLLDRDVLTVSSEELKDAKVVWTMLGGLRFIGLSRDEPGIFPLKSFQPQRTQSRRRGRGEQRA